MFGDCSANIPRLVADHLRIFTEHFSRQNIANGSRKISMQALKILGIGKCSRTSTTSSDYSPKVRLYLPNIAWCLSISIGNASATLKSPVGPRHKQGLHGMRSLPNSTRGRQRNGNPGPLDLWSVSLYQLERVLLCSIKIWYYTSDHVL